MGARNHDLCGHWRDELKTARSQPQGTRSAVRPTGECRQRRESLDARTVSAKPRPRIEHTPARHGPSRRAAAPVCARHLPRGHCLGRLRYRHVTQFEDYESLE